MKQALLVIDVQRGLFEPAPHEGEAVIERINRLADRARDAGVPVVYIQHETRQGALAHGSAGWQLAEGLQARETDHLVRKTTPDSFLRTDLAEKLSAWGVEQVVICGYACEFCVDTTTRRAAALGYPVILVADAHTTHDKPHMSGEQIRAHHNATLPNISSFGVKISAVPADDVVW
ncbi:cysteine hydrolase family protein [Ideonella sp. DXS29W]|uniref:Cysteine hydrolase family protein n=1 Tax=Ideonella lacteola TaxID=2984193 RepID=A0ABU9BPA3_9BURK